MGDLMRRFAVGFGELLVSWGAMLIDTYSAVDSVIRHHALEDEIYARFFIRPATRGVGFGSPHPPKAVILDMPFDNLEYRRREGTHYYNKGGEHFKTLEAVENLWQPAHKAWVRHHEQEERARRVWGDEG
jgi:hypothetical protein